jgi:adenylylsulfate kinase
MASNAAITPVLVVTGPVGVGKSAVAGAVSTILDGEDVAHAVVDMDWLRWCHPTPDGDEFHTALGLRNLAAVWANYRAAGAGALVVVDIVETRSMVAEYERAVPGARVAVVRLHATLPTIHHRLEGRETGADLEWHRERAVELARIMDDQSIGDAHVDTEGKSIEEVAREVVACWVDLANLGGVGSA